MIRASRPARMLAILLATAACTGGPIAPPPAGPFPVPRAAVEVPCLDLHGAPDRGKAMLGQGRYQIGSHPAVALPDDPTWREDPLGERNWRFRYHNLRWTEDLVAAWRATDDLAYLERWRTLLRDWYADNPREAPRSDYSWQHHATGQRAAVYACATRFLDEPWLWDAIRLHGQVLAREGFYVRRGNHALNQNIGLFTAGCALGHLAWKNLAAERIRALGVRSIDADGVSDEGSVFYQLYNYRRYGVALTTLRRCGTEPPAPVVLRRARMSRFLAHATMPDGEYVRLGDTLPRRAEVIDRTIAAFAATQGLQGPHPEETTVVFDAGYAFGRAGWGEERAAENEMFYALRFGPAPQRGRRDIEHMHHEGTALQLYGYGDAVLEDAGAGRYRADNWRRYFRGPSGHNRVTVEGRAFDPAAPTRSVRARSTPRWDSYVLQTGAWTGVRTVRRVLVSKRDGYVLVQDDLRSTKPMRARQWWHLPAGSDAERRGMTVRTGRDEANVTVRVLSGARKMRIAKGERRPIQGWASYRYGQWEPAPVAEVIAAGRAIRVVTLLVPWKHRERHVTARIVRDGPKRTVVRVRAGGHTDRIEFAGRIARVIPGS